MEKLSERLQELLGYGDPSTTTGLEIASVIHQARNYEEIIYGTNIAVHSAPRTASSSMMNFLIDGLHTKIMHVHGLTNRWYKHFSKGRLEKVLSIGKEHWKVVTLIRDPVARNLSAYMQFENNPSRNGFLTEFDHYDGIHHIGGEFCEFWGLDLFTEGFRAPYTVYKNRLMIIRFEDIIKDPDIAKQAVWDWLKREITIDFPHTSENRRIDYRKEFQIPPRYVNHMYNQKYSRFFYTNAELREMADYWMNKQMDDDAEGDLILTLK